jgi:hypothetical protein
MNILNLENELRKSYKKVFSLKKNKPDWAVKKLKGNGLIHPAIPFIGKNYNKTKVLLYASAENLTGYDGYLDNDNFAINRRREYYNEDKKEEKPFPGVHIGPVGDGSLLIVSAYILNILGIKLEYSTPYEFIEYIAVDNFCKYTKGSLRNEDYAGVTEKIEKSFSYIENDLKILKPKIIILPKTIYKHKEVKQKIERIVPKCLIIPIYQINSTTVNTTINKYWKRKKKSEIKNILFKWQEMQKKLGNKITGKTNKYFYSVYTYLDDVVKKSTNGT